MDTGAHLTSLAANRIYCKAYLQLPTREPLQCTAWYLNFILIDIAACFLDLGICVPSLFTPGCTSIFPSFNNFLEIISAEQNQWVQIFFVMFILCTCKSGMRKIFLTSGRISDICSAFHRLAGFSHWSRQELKQKLPLSLNLSVT